ncbi:DUF6567 family protein [Rapidithrix thailandica]|uniref:DUF6567 family protein n=1 Tax=Rapidithrix thailandica TaxID=413964 RepID=A0AAW9RZG0_9BACT
MLKSTIFILLSTIFFTSCAFHNGNLSGTTVVLDPSYKPVGLAYGTAQTSKAFGIGGNSKDALVLEAKKSMYLNYPLESGQVYGNYTIDFKNSINPFTQTTKVIVSADILSNDSTATWKISDELGERVLQIDGFSIGQEVIIKSKKGEAPLKGKILNSEDEDGPFLVGYTNQYGIYKTESIPAWDLQFEVEKNEKFTQKVEKKTAEKELKVGDKVMFKKYYTEEKGVILEIIKEKSKALIEYQDNKEKKLQVKVPLSRVRKIENTTNE